MKNAGSGHGKGSTEKRLEHINRVLRAIRNVNQLIVKEKDPDALIDRACRLLVENRGYFNAWISLCNEKGKPGKVAGSGLGKEFSSLIKILKGGTRVACQKRALKQAGVQVIDNPHKTCTDCPLSSNYKGRAALVIRLEHEGTTYGTMTVSVAKEIAEDEEERLLFNELSSDIAYALCNIKIEEKRKQAEKELHESEERYRRLFETAQDGMLILDATTGKILDANPFIKDMLGYQIEELAEKQLWEIGTFRDVVENKGKLRALQAQGYVRYENFQLKSRSGKEVPVEFVSNTYKTGDRKVIQCNIRDITERKKAEEKIRESEDKFRFVFTASNAGKSITLPGGEINVNNAFCKMLGYRPEELKNKTWQELTPADDIASIEKKLDPLLRGKKNSVRFEKRYIQKNGSLIWADVSVAIRREEKGGPLYFITTVLDITKLKKTEEELRRSEEAQRAIISASPLAIFSLSPEGIVLSWNRAAEEIFGWKEEEIRGKFLPVVPEDKKREFDKLRRQVLKGESFSDMELKRRRKNGSVIDISLSTAPIRDSKGRIVAIMAVAADITENIILLNKLQESEAKYRGVVMNLLEGFYRASLDGKLIDYNKELTVILGLDPGKDYTGINLPDFWQNPDDRKTYLEEIKKRGFIRNYEINARRQNGEKIVIQVNSRQLKDKTGRITGIEGTFLDITERKKTVLEIERKTKFIQTVLDNLPIGVALNDIESGKTTYMNEKFSEIYGWPEKDLKNVDGFFRKVYPDSGYREKMKRRIMADIRSGDPERMRWNDVRVTHRDGSGKIVNALNIPLFDQNTMISTVMDITELKRAEEELIKHRNQLATMVREKTGELKERVKELEKFRDATIEREFRMKELREEIKRLRKGKK